MLATKRLFINKGYGNTSINDIINEVKLPRDCSIIITLKKRVFSATSEMNMLPTSEAVGWKPKEHLKIY